MYAYRAFGLGIRSDLELPELTLGEAGPDLEICFGEVPESLAGPVATGVRFQATSTQFLLKVDGHARYLATGGREIVIQRESRAATEAIRLFLLNSVMGAILQQRGQLVLHASAVEARDGAVLVAGASGVGKSTLAAALARRGRRILSDEIAAITLREGRPYVLPGFPQLNIWADAAEALDLDLGALRRLRPGLEKYALALDKSYCDTALPISQLHVLSTSNTGELKTERLKGVEKVTAVVAQTYHPRFLGNGDWKERHFEQCAAVAANARVYKLVRPRLPFLLASLADLLERESEQ